MEGQMNAEFWRKYDVWGFRIIYSLCFLAYGMFLIYLPVKWYDYIICFIIGLFMIYYWHKD